MLCCHTEQASHETKARLSASLSSPQTHLITSSSSASSSSSLTSCEAAAFFVCFVAVPFATGFGVGAGEEDAFLCWPLVARPERRGSSVFLLVCRLFSGIRASLRPLVRVRVSSGLQIRYDRLAYRPFVRAVWALVELLSPYERAPLTNATREGEWKQFHNED
jgi:hypothetical protein